MKNKKNIYFGFVFSILILGIVTPLFLNTIYVKAQNNHIEVYAYDALTLDPLVGAEFLLYDDSWMYLTSGVADGSGFYNFTGLEVGSFYVEFDALGYPYDVTFVTLSYDDDVETITFLSEPYFIPGDGFIEVHVYDSLTLDPIEEAIVELSVDWAFRIVDFTDASGFCNLTGLGANSYLIFVNDPEHDGTGQTVTIDYDGEGEYVEFYLVPYFTPGIGFIEVEVYGRDTLAPLPFAQVYLYSEKGNPIDDNTTDALGFYNFTGLGAGIYEVAAEVFGYISNDTWITIDFDGEGEHVLLYLPPEPTSGEGYIEVYVYDQTTFLPLENVDLNLFTQYSIYISSGVTNITGFHNFTNLGVETYYVEALLLGYERNETSVTIDFDGEGEYVELYLSPVFRSIEILSPVESETVEGGSVLVICNISEIDEFSYVEIYVNDIFITRNYFHRNLNPFEFIVPIFLNGTNEIEVVGHWYDHSTASDLVTIDSMNVIPIVNLREGDIINYYYDATALGIEAYWNFTFVEWFSPFQMNTSMSIVIWEEGILTDVVNDYLIVNVLNGYVPYDPSYQFYQDHLFPFCTLLPNAQIGDVAPIVPWDDLVTVTGSMTWQYTDVWVLEGYADFEYTIYSEMNSNIVYYIELLEGMEIILTETTVDFTIPYVSDELNLHYSAGSTGNTIDWDVSDMNPSQYYIYRDAVEIDSGVFDSGVISINVDNLAQGSYAYHIVIYDLAGNSAQDTLIVYVEAALISEFNTWVFLLPIPAFMVASYSIVLKRKNNK